MLNLNSSVIPLARIGVQIAFVAEIEKSMNNKTLGIALLVIGIGMTVFTGFNIITREKVVDLGSVEISRAEKTPIYWSPIIGGVLVAAGLLILVLGKKNN